MPSLRFSCARTIILLVCAMFLFNSCYVVTQGIEYLSIRSKAESLENVLLKTDTAEDERLLLERAKAARLFALEKIGLKETKNYTSIVRTERSCLAFVVQACAELSFDRHIWAYPIVGKLPYRGYFKREDAGKEASRLKAKGLDVIVRPVDAFSTLGWFSDPLFSFMKTYREADVAELVIHEMTHSTIFLKGNGKGYEQFNEELATFVGREGALLYLSEKYGDGSPEVKEQGSRKRDAESFAAFLAGSAAELEVLYQSDTDPQQKRVKKAEIIANRARVFKESYKTLFESDLYENVQMDKINNAWLDLYRLYEGENHLYRDYYTRVASSDLKLFIQKVGHIAKTDRNPKEAMLKEIGD